MKHRPAVLALVPVLVALVGLAVQPASALAAKPAKKAKATVFEACRHGCHYRTIQKAVATSADSHAGSCALPSIVIGDGARWICNW